MNLNLNKKAIFIIIWYLVLWGVCTWVMFEYFNPLGQVDPSSHMTRGFLFFRAAGPSILLLATTGGPLFFYLLKRKLSNKTALGLLAVLLIETTLITALLVPRVNASALYKSRVQWYVNDLESQGFNVLYTPGPNRVVTTEYAYSYSEIINKAKEINCTTIYFFGVPNYIFYVKSYASIVAHVEGQRPIKYVFSLTQPVPD